MGDMADASVTIGVAKQPTVVAIGMRPKPR
jgi:hypothetical protein